MKPILTLITAFIISGIASAQANNDWSDLQLKGKVKSLATKETYRYKKAGVFTAWEKSYRRLTKFNSTGFRTEFSEFTGNDSLSYKSINSYNPAEKKAELSYFNKDLKPTTKRVYKLNDKGYKIEELQYATDGALSHRYVYGYDKAGNMIEMTGYKRDGKLSSKTSWKYNPENHRIEYLLETPGYANSSRKFVNDDRGNVTEETWYNGKGSVDFRFVRTYDANGNKIKEIKYKDGDKLLDTVTWHYEYDKKQNWTKRTETTSDGADFHIEERTIVYY